MLGKPMYKYGDKVSFSLNNGIQKEEKIGIIKVIDTFGTLFQNKEPSYDIMVENETECCLYKHMQMSIQKNHYYFEYNESFDSLIIKIENLICFNELKDLAISYYDGFQLVN